MSAEETPKVDDIFYRYDYYRYHDTRLEVEQEKFRVIKVTPCGVWIKSTHWIGMTGGERFVLLTHGSFPVGRYGGPQPTRKRFAHPTPKAALESFLARKYMQQIHLERQLLNVKESIEIAEKKSQRWQEMEKIDAEINDQQA